MKNIVTEGNMAAQNQLFMNVMRILTPEEINELITSSEGDSRVLLTEMMERSFAGLPLREEESEGAKILPFKKPGEEESSEVKATETLKEVKAGEKARELVAQFKNNPMDFIKVPSHKRETLFDEDGCMKDTSSFIIGERSRFQESQSKLKSREVIDLYQKHANVDIEQEKSFKENLERNGHTGALVNKKQF